MRVMLDAVGLVEEPVLNLLCSICAIYHEKLAMAVQIWMESSPGVSPVFRRFLSTSISWTKCL